MRCAVTCSVTPRCAPLSNATGSWWASAHSCHRGCELRHQIEDHHSRSESTLGRLLWCSLAMGDGRCTRPTAWCARSTTWPRRPASHMLRWGERGRRRHRMQRGAGGHHAAHVRHGRRPVRTRARRRGFAGCTGGSGPGRLRRGRCGVARRGPRPQCRCGATSAAATCRAVSTGGWRCTSGHGRLPLADVLEPARRYADGGLSRCTTAGASPAAWCIDVAGADDFRVRRALRTGDRIRRPLRGASAGRDRRRAAARASTAASSAPGWWSSGEGCTHPHDLEQSNAEWVTPLGIHAWGHEVWTVPPPSQGYLTLAGRVDRHGPRPARRSRRPALGAPAVEAARAGGPRPRSTCCSTVPTATRSWTRSAGDAAGDDRPEPSQPP